MGRVARAARDSPSAFPPARASLMRREVAQQWELFQRTGLECRFINSHHHLHAHPFVYRALLETVGPRFPGWIRLGQPRAFRPRVRLAALVGARRDLSRRGDEGCHAGARPIRSGALDRIFE